MGIIFVHMHKWKGKNNGGCKTKAVQVLSKANVEGEEGKLHLHPCSSCLSLISNSTRFLQIQPLDCSLI